MSTTPARYKRGGPQEHTIKVAEHAAEAWYDAHGGGDVEIPLSVVAALSQITPPQRELTTIAAAFAKVSPDEFADTPSAKSGRCSCGPGPTWSTRSTRCLSPGSTRTGR